MIAFVMLSGATSASVKWNLTNNQSVTLIARFCQVKQYKRLECLRSGSSIRWLSASRPPELPPSDWRGVIESVAPTLGAVFIILISSASRGCYLVYYVLRRGGSNRVRPGFGVWVHDWVCLIWAHLRYRNETKLKYLLPFTNGYYLYFVFLALGRITFCVFYQAPFHSIVSLLIKTSVSLSFLQYKSSK